MLTLAIAIIVPSGSQTAKPHSGFMCIGKQPRISDTHKGDRDTRRALDHRRLHLTESARYHDFLTMVECSEITARQAAADKDVL